jgi:hypothetical protein
MSSKELHNEKIEHIYRLVETTLGNVEKIKDLLSKLDQDEKKDIYRTMEGTVGVFDGTHLVTSDGQKLEVPANYAAKSRICFGDTLKLIKEDGKDVYKQIDKPARKKVAGVMTKKEGKWYIISDSGTFKVSDTAAEFQHAELNDEAEAFIPESNLNSPFAALDVVKKKDQPVVQKPQIEHKKYSEPKVVEIKRDKPVVEQVVIKNEPIKEPSIVATPVAEKPQKAPEHTQERTQPRSQPRSDDRPRRSFDKGSDRPRSSSPHSGSRPPARGGRPAPRREYVDRIVEKAPIEKAPLPPTPTITNLEDDDLR